MSTRRPGAPTTCDRSPAATDPDSVARLVVVDADTANPQLRADSSDVDSRRTRVSGPRLVSTNAATRAARAHDARHLLSIGHTGHHVDLSPAFATDALSKVFPGGTTALDQLTVAVPRGSVGLVGANGAGQDDAVPPPARPDPPRPVAPSTVCGRVVTDDPIGVRAGSASCPSTTACHRTRPRPTSWPRSAS